MTDNIFETETTALAHVACTPQESGILLTDFAAAYISQRQSLLDPLRPREDSMPDFIYGFLRRICNTRGQFLMARGVRQGCPASGFLFALAFDPVFRWLQEAVIQGTLTA